jgi:hypothetical protein
MVTLLWKTPRGFSLEERTVGGRGHGLRIEGIDAMPDAS